MVDSLAKQGVDRVIPLVDMLCIFQFFGILPNAFMHMSSIFVFLFLYVILFILNIIFSYQSKKEKIK